MFNNSFQDNEDDAGGVVFRDVIFLALAGFVAIVILLLPHVNSPTKATEVKPPGNIIVEIRWPDEIDADVDLWVEAPRETPVGYSNKNGPTFDLLRDDLGHQADISNLNYEMAFGRGAPAGEYTINVHLYRNPGNQPVPVTVVVSTRPLNGAVTKQILVAKVVLNHSGQEITVFRFTLRDDVTLVPGSVHDVPKPLRSRR